MLFHRIRNDQNTAYHEVELPGCTVLAMFAVVYCIIPTAADICAELISQKVVETLTNLKVQHVSNEVMIPLYLVMYKLPII